MMNRENRINAAKAMGIDTRNTFDVKIANVPTDADITVVINGKPVNINEFIEKGGLESDPILEKVKSDGYVKNAHLFRRWVMAQTIRMIRYSDSHFGKGYDAALRSFKYKYQFDMLDNELHTLSVLEHKDPEALEEREKFFNYRVVNEMIDDHERKIGKAICKMHESGKTKTSAYYYLKKAQQIIKDFDIRFASGNSYDFIYKTYHKLYTDGAFTNLDKYFYVTKSEAFHDAFKAAGGYYSLKNGIMFHDMRPFGSLNVEDELEELKAHTNSLKSGGKEYMLEQIFENYIKKYNFNLSESIAEHRNK